MENSPDYEICFGDDPLKTGLIDDIDERGYLVSSSFEKEMRNDFVKDRRSEKDEDDGVHVDIEFEKDEDDGVHVDIESEKDEDDGVHVDIESERFDNEALTGERFEDDNIMGKVFDTTDDAYAFYNRYALLHGFGIRIYSTYKNKITREHYRKIFVCNKQGFKDLKGSNVSKKRRRDLRTGCEAMFRISKTKDGKWLVDIFSDTHNHGLTLTPTKVVKHRSHGKFHRSILCKSLMSELGQSGLRPCQIKKVVNTIKSPFENDVTSKQCADVLAEERKQYRGKEFYGVIKYFQDKLIEDRDLYFTVDLCEDGSPKNLFWADGRSRDSYIKFGDVVVFDVTYMTNRFRMPFAPFVGVNHHGQSIIFGGALLENEKQETFEWLFEKFLECMFNKHPTAIITDQDKAICNAIKKFFPQARHRYCSWHIKKHEIEHLGPITTRYSGFQELYKQWVKSNTVEEFESRWKVLADEYNFESNSWIAEMYKQRHLWAKAFLKDCFFAGMTTSGRSESIHSFFDNFVTSKTMLNEFVVQYDKAVKCRRTAEEDEDFKTMNSRPILSSVNPIEATAGTRYTSKMFEVFQKEWMKATNNLIHETLTKNLKEVVYKVGQVDVPKKYWRIVNFRLSNVVDVTCSCAKFETYGILCKHILYVLKKKHVETLPDHYILPRWTLDSRYKVDNIGFQDIHEEDGVSALQLWCLQSKFTKAIELATNSPLELKKLHTMLGQFLEQQMDRNKSTELESASQDAHVGTSQINMMPQISIRDPQVLTKTKGRPKSANRIKSSLEAPKKRTCSYCKKLGHYINSCPQKKVNDSLKENEG